MAEEKPRERNPFNPTAPSSPEYFAGRLREIDFIVRALNQTRHGSQQNVMVTGERGIGKSSLALLARYIAQEPRTTWSTDCKFVTGDRKSTRLNSSHLVISYAVFCL